PPCDSEQNDRDCALRLLVKLVPDQFKLAVHTLTSLGIRVHHDHVAIFPRHCTERRRQRDLQQWIQSTHQRDLRGAYISKRGNVFLEAASMNKLVKDIFYRLKMAEFKARDHILRRYFGALETLED